MILVDTCVWIDLLRGRTTPQTRFLTALAKSPRNEICLSHVVYFEVLRGIVSDLERRKVKAHFESLAMMDYKNEGLNDLIDIFLLCRCRGVNLPKLGEWLILKTVLDHDLELLTSDRDFHAIHKVWPFGLVGQGD